MRSQPENTSRRTSPRTNDGVAKNASQTNPEILSRRPPGRRAAGDSERNADQARDEESGDVQRERRGQRAGDPGRHGLAVHEREPEVEARGAQDPRHEALGDGPVQAVEMPEGRERLGRDRRGAVPAGARRERRRVAGRGRDEPEDERENAQQRQHGRGRPPQGEAEHAGDVTWRPWR